MTRYFVGDFETTVFAGQKSTEVWASASVELYSDDVNVFHSIAEQFDYFVSLKTNIICYYHNLKFDGCFWLSYLLYNLNFEQAYVKESEDINSYVWKKKTQMKNNSFIYSISDTGLWYKIIIKVKNNFIEFRDSYKLLPFSVKRIGESFDTKHKKLDMQYEGFRYAGCEITEEEKEYIKNDVLVVKEALEILFNEGHKKLTIGSCCLSEFKELYGSGKYKHNLPDLYNDSIDKELYGVDNSAEWIRRSYRGGWCYVVSGKENKIFTKGFTADVNSLYPSMMSSESGNYYPIGRPKFWKGNFIPKLATVNHRYYFVRFQTRFYLKKNKLPFVQIKNNFLYNSREMLKTSDVYNRETNTYHAQYRTLEGEIVYARPILTMTMTDYKLFLEHYDVMDFEILDGCYFESAIGIFDDYINKYKKIKKESKGAKRELAKLFLNNLYGKMASSKRSNFKVALTTPDKIVTFFNVVANDKTAGYIPIGSAITSYARNFTIRAAQANYYGKDKAGFIYADTDSIHCDLPLSQVKGIKVDDKEFCCWKIEALWDKGLFVRAKTYIEHVVGENLKKIDTPYYNVKCAGMPTRCKNLFLASIGEMNVDPITDDEKEFLTTKRTLNDFKIGLKIPSKLMPKRIMGGVVLVPTTYEMR